MAAVGCRGVDGAQAVGTGGTNEAALSPSPSPWGSWGGGVKLLRIELNRVERRKRRDSAGVRDGRHLACGGRRRSPEVEPLGWSIVLLI